jgi:hypothetical protein
MGMLRKDDSARQMSEKCPTLEGRIAAQVHQIAIRVSYSMRDLALAENNEMWNGCSNTLEE